MQSPNLQTNLRRFTELVLADGALHDQLHAAPDEPAFVTPAVSRLAAERGCAVDVAKFQAAIVHKSRASLERWL